MVKGCFWNGEVGICRNRKRRWSVRNGGIWEGWKMRMRIGRRKEGSLPFCYSAFLIPETDSF